MFAVGFHNKHTRGVAEYWYVRIVSDENELSGRFHLVDVVDNCFENKAVVKIVLRLIN